MLIWRDGGWRTRRDGRAEKEQRSTSTRRQATTERALDLLQLHAGIIILKLAIFVLSAALLVLVPCSGQCGLC